MKFTRVYLFTGSEVAASLPGRVGKQCRERWYNHLDPGIKKGDWTAEVVIRIPIFLGFALTCQPLSQEDEIILTYQRLYGNQWSKVLFIMLIFI